MTTVTSSYVPVWRFADNNNNPLVGGKVYTYYAGTTTPAATYTDATGSTPLTNPIILNARGETANASGASCSVWFSTTIAYKIVVQDSSGNLIWTVDNYTIPSQAYSAAYADTFTATAGQTVFTLTGTVGSQSALDVSLDGATLVNGVDFTWTSPSTLTLTVGAKVGQILLVKYLIAQAMGTMVAGGTSGQILYNNGGSVQGFTMSGDVTVNTSNGNAKVAQASAANIAYMSKVSCWGDSLTQSTGGQTPYPTQLSSITGYTTVNGGVGGETSSQILTRFVAATSQWPNLTIIWAGRNNYNYPTQVLSDIATMVADIGHDGYLVLSILNNNTEVSGSAGYNAIAYLNSQLASIYGSHYLDVRSILVAAYNPGNPTDVTDHANDCPPSSLRYDTLHLNTAGYGVVAAAIKNVVSTLRGTRGVPVSSAGTVDLFSSPPQIGVVTPNAGAFTTVTATTVATTNATVGGKQISISGDGTSFQFAGPVVPSVDATYSLGYSSTQLRWTAIYATGTVYCSGLNISGKTVALSGDSTSLQVNAPFIPAADGTIDIGYSASQNRWKNGWFTGTVSGGSMLASVHYSNTKTYTVGIGASQDLVSVGSYQATANGIMVIKSLKSGGVTIANHSVNIMGGGTPGGVTQLGSEIYAGVGSTFTLAETSTTGVNKVTLTNTSGASATVVVTFIWFYVDNNATITYL